MTFTLRYPRVQSLAGPEFARKNCVYEQFVYVGAQSLYAPAENDAVRGVWGHAGLHSLLTCSR